MFLPPVFAYQGKLLRKIDARDLTHMEVDKNYVKVHHVNAKEKFEVRCTLADAVASLRPLFVHVSRKTAVSILHIDKIQKYVLMVGEKTEIKIAKSYYRPLINALGVIGGKRENEDEEGGPDQPGSQEEN